MIEFANLLNIAVEASIVAGKEILKVYGDEDFGIEYKQDESPLTLADKKAHEIIVSYLNKTGIPVLSEEGKHLPYTERKNWEVLWIVDPLDGTKEFIKRNGEFTVNIALVKNGETKMGVIYSPVLKSLYFNELDGAAYWVNDVEANWNTERLFYYLDTNKQEIPLKRKEKYRVVASRSHLSDETKKYINELKKTYPDLEITSIGSSLKLCLLAKGEADIYPRFAPTMEWDIAAGHAILKAAGGNVLDKQHGKELKYNKEDLLNPWFIAKMEKIKI